MTCARCGHPLEPVDVDEVSKNGTFSEEWQCTGCGAKRFVEGREEQSPREWDEYGQAVDGNSL